MTLALSVSASATRWFQPVQAARDPAHEDDRVLGRFEQCRGLRHQLGRGRGGGRRHEAGDLDRPERLGELRLLHLGIEVDVDRPHRGRIGDPMGAQDRLARRRRRSRLVVPFGVVAHDGALVAGGMDPVDPRPALGRIHRTGRAQDHHRHAVAPGIEDRHGGVEQADIGMHRGRHRLVGDLGVALRDRDRDLLVQAEQHLRLLVAEIVDDRIVQAAIAGAGIERDIGDIQRTQGFGDDVAAPAGSVGGGQFHRPVELAQRGMGRIRGRAVGGVRRRLGLCSRHWMILERFLGCGEGAAIEPDQRASRNRASSVTPA